MINFDWALSCRNSGLSTKLEVRQMFKTKVDLTNAVKR
jgi:hypothetical protein